jgi:ribosomal protein L11 methylase PrmA
VPDPVPDPVTTTLPPATALAGSFRDPSGFVYARDGVLYRQVNRTFAAEFEACLRSGLYDELIDAGLLVPHHLTDLSLAATADAHAVLVPDQVPFISYPYEWSFGQLKSAALSTLDVQSRALARGFTLRDASAYNVQFVDGRPLLIDTLSFEPHRDGRPWAAYRQFCEHFLAPLLLMSTRDVRCAQLLRPYLDGIPLDLASSLLPWHTWASPHALLHIHLHARAQRRYAEASVTAVTRERTIGTPGVLALVRSLAAAVRGLEWRPTGTEWADYASATNYSEAAADAKRRLLHDYLVSLGPRSAWDLGANTGVYSRVAREVVPFVVAFDLDPAAVERNYRQVEASGERGLLPLLLDLANPSPAQGWAHHERMSLEERGPADVVIALALVHHLAIGHNVPLDLVASFLARLARALVIEFVDKEDSQVRRLLRNRPDIFPGYTQETFEQAFAARFAIRRCERVGDAARWLYLMTPRDGTGWT